MNSNIVSLITFAKCAPHTQHLAKWNKCDVFKQFPEEVGRRSAQEKKKCLQDKIFLFICVLHGESIAENGEVNPRL